jgi:AraC-like DNA-binding protein
VTVICHRQLLGLPHGVFSKPASQKTDALARMTLEFARSALNEDEGLSPRAVSALAHSVQQCILGNLESDGMKAPNLNCHAKLVADAKQHIAMNLHDVDLRADSIAEALGVSRRTLYAAFATMSETPARSIQEARLLHAQQTLAGCARNNHNITRLALDVGFNDAAHFSRSYRKMFGEPPSTTRDRFCAKR